MAIKQFLGLVFCLTFFLAGCGVKENAGIEFEKFEGEIPGRFIERRTGIEFVLVPAGSFLMGSNDTDLYFEMDETPAHKVLIDAFFLATTEVTQGQWQIIMRSNPSSFNYGNNYPVETVSFEDVQEFLKKSHKKTGLPFRLPTEAEWEYACRSGSKTPYCCEISENSVLLEYAWFCENSGGETHPVKSFFPNEWNLYDMHGNVSEWVADGRRGYQRITVTNPVGPLNSEKGMARGGCWLYPAHMCRCPRRLPFEKDIRSYVLGFRVALDVSSISSLIGNH